VKVHKGGASCRLSIAIGHSNHDAFHVNCRCIGNPQGSRRGRAARWSRDCRRWSLSHGAEATGTRLGGSLHVVRPPSMSAYMTESMRAAGFADSPLMVTKRDHRSASHTTKSIASSLAIHWPRPACGINEIAPDIRRAVKDARGEQHVMQSRSSRRSGQATGAIALIRGGYNGQRSCERHLQPEHMAAPTKPANVKKALADSEVSTNGTGLSAPISQRPRSWRR
jgi:hypothetical protein